MTQAFNLSQLANNVNTSGQLNAAAGLYNQTPVINGGTGLGTLTSGAVLVGAGTSAVSLVPAATSGNVLTANGTAWVSQLASGGTPIVTSYSSPSPWTKPATLKAVKITMVSGGGGGGPVGTGAGSVGGSGGDGGYAQVYLQASSIPGPVTITVGAGGGNATAGGTASFGAIYSLPGGGAGAAGPAGANGANGGSFSITNSPNTSVASHTGNGLWGIKGTSSTVAGNPGTGYGAGGGGGLARPGTPSPGGSGTSGMMIVEEFY